MSDKKKKQPRTFPAEYPEAPERYTETFVAIDRIEPADGRRTPRDPAVQEGQDIHGEIIRQNSDYRDGNKAAPDNNLFFGERSNPLSSKGD